MAPVACMASELGAPQQSASGAGCAGAARDRARTRPGGPPHVALLSAWTPSGRGEANVTTPPFDPPNLEFRDCITAWYYVAMERSPPLSVRLDPVRLGRIDAWARRFGVKRHAAILMLLDRGLGLDRGAARDGAAERVAD